MGMTVGDVIFEIERYKMLKEKFSADYSFTEGIRSSDDVLTCIKSKLTYADIVQVQTLIDNQIAMLKKVEVKDENDS